MELQNHSSFLKSQLSYLYSSEAYQDSTLVCRNGVMCLNSLLTFLLFQEDLANINNTDEDLHVVLPEFDVEVIHNMLQKLLINSSESPVSKPPVAKFSLLLPFQPPVNSPQSCAVRRRLQRAECACQVCGKIFQLTKWEAARHESLHCTSQGKVKCLIPSGSLGKCKKEFETKEELQEHMALTHKIKYSKCSICNTVFKSDNLKQEHLKSVHHISAITQESLHMHMMT